MSTFSIFKDQENNDAISRKKNGNAVSISAIQQPKRSVLGIVNENKTRSQQVIAAKQGLKISNDENALARKIVSKKCDAKPLQPKSFSIFEDKKADNGKKQSIKPSKVVAKPSSFLPVAKEERIVRRDEPKGREDEEISQDTAISADISHLRIPDSNDEVGYSFKSDHDMSMDSFCCSPMSIDKTNITRRTQHQITLDHFFNVDEYEDEIYTYIKESEMRYRPKPGYMRKQPDITYSMRSILVDWLVEVADEYNLQPETMFLAVSYIDRFLSLMSVVRGKLQLVGTAAMFIASKFEEIYPPDVGEFVYITDDTYTKKQVLRMEHLILKVLAFDMSAPTILRFAVKYCLISSSSESVKHLAQYLCELSLLDAERFLHFLPSELGAAATALARHTLGVEPWPESLQKLTGVSLEQLSPCLRPLTIAFSTASSYPQQAVYEKFSSSKWSGVAHMKPLSPGLVPDIAVENSAPQEAVQKQESSTTGNSVALRSSKTACKSN